MVKRIEIDLDTPVQTHKTTIVTGVVAYIDNVGHGADFVRQYEDFEIVGESRKDNGDKFNAEIGVKYATARALEAAARKIRKQADGLVRNAEHIKAHKAQIQLQAFLETTFPESKPQGLPGLQEHIRTSDRYNVPVGAIRETKGLREKWTGSKWKTIKGRV